MSFVLGVFDIPSFKAAVENQKNDFSGIETTITELKDLSLCKIEVRIFPDQLSEDSPLLKSEKGENKMEKLQNTLQMLHIPRSNQVVNGIQITGDEGYERDSEQSIVVNGTDNLLKLAKFSPFPGSKYLEADQQLKNQRRNSRGI